MIFNFHKIGLTLWMCFTNSVVQRNLDDGCSHVQKRGFLEAEIGQMLSHLKEAVHVRKYYIIHGE